MDYKKLLKKLLKWLLYFLLLLLLAFGTAYWTAPYWVPGQVQKFLPDTIKVQSLTLERPGLNSAYLNRLQLNFQLESKIQITLEGVKLSYSLLQKKLNKITAEKASIQIENSSSNSTTKFSNNIQIIELPTDELEIKALSVKGLFIQDLDFADLKLVQKGQQLNLESLLSFIGLEFNLQSQLIINNNTLKSIQTYISQGSDKLELKLIPSLDSEQGFDWQIDSQLDTQNYLPIEGLSDLKVKGSGSFYKSQFIDLLFNPDFILEIPLETARILSQQEIDNLLANKGIKIDSQQVTAGARLELFLKEKAYISIEPDNNYLLTLAAGSFPIKLQHPLLKTQLLLNKVVLDPSLPLSDPKQQISGEMNNVMQFKDLHYNAESLTANSEQLALKIHSNFSIKNSELLLTTKDIQLQLGASSLNNKNFNSRFKPTQWQGEAVVRQNLIGEDTANVQNIKLTQLKPIALNVKLKDEQLKFEQLTNQITIAKENININSQANKLSFSNQPLVLKQLKLNSQVNLPKQHIRGNLAFKDASFINTQLNLDKISGDFKWNLKQPFFKLNGHLKQQKELIPLSYQIDLNKDQHNLSIQPLRLDTLLISRWLNPILNQYPDLNIESSKLESSKLSGNPLNLAFSGVLKLKNLNLNYDQLRVINLQLNDTLSRQPNLDGKLTGKIAKIEVASGIFIQDLQFFMQHQLDRFLLNDIYGNLLGGSFYIPQLKVDPEKILPFTTHLKAINLGDLLIALQAESLFIKGIFDFTLPINISAKGQSITNGNFQNIGSGILQVDSGVSAETNIAFQALENFHYQHFSGTINYDEDGIYHLHIKLKGNNPDLYDGFPIELNLNLEGNLPNLLYSMLISGDMAKPIIDKYHSGELQLPAEAKTNPSNL